MTPKLPIPETDSIEALARFWDTHDLTDFEEELEEVGGVFERKATVTIELQLDEAQAVSALASPLGLPEADLIHRWVREKLNLA